jgi:large subunit ribosomal protein L21e
MVKRVRGKRGGHSRQQLSKHRQKTTVNQLLKKFSVGDLVLIDIDSSVQDAMPHPRYQGHQGTIVALQGDCYVIAIKDGDKPKKIVTSPAHMRNADTGKK